MWYIGSSVSFVDWDIKFENITLANISSGLDQVLVNETFR